MAGTGRRLKSEEIKAILSDVALSNKLKEEYKESLKNTKQLHQKLLREGSLKAIARKHKIALATLQRIRKNKDK